MIGRTPLTAEANGRMELQVPILSANAQKAALTLAARVSSISSGWLSQPFTHRFAHLFVHPTDCLPVRLPACVSSLKAVWRAALRSLRLTRSLTQRGVTVEFNRDPFSSLTRLSTPGAGAEAAMFREHLLDEPPLR